MLGVMDRRVGKALRGSFEWEKPNNEWFYWLWTMLGGMGPMRLGGKCSQRISRRNKVKIVWQCPRSSKTNLLDLAGIWMSIQAAVEKAMYMKLGDIKAILVNGL
jgi:hypothetical protein